MLKQTFSFMLMLFLAGCGNDSSKTASEPSIEPYFYQQWSLDKNDDFYTLNAIDSDAHIHPNGLLSQYNGRGVKIAIIDESLDVHHEDLVGAIIGTYDLETGTTDVSNDNQAQYHGTAVTGIVGARANSKGIKGVASGADIIFLKYKEFMSDSDVIELFDRAEAFGADIISNSWGTGAVSPAVTAKIVDLANNGRGAKGTVIVFACGNESAEMGNDESAIPEVISVGATNKYNLIAAYSNFGINLDIVAPGGYYLGITTLDSMGSDGGASINENYLLYNDSNGFAGTSASAPIVSGVIALMLEKNPNLSRIEIENILKNSADKIGTVPYDINGRNDYYGYGKINLTKAMNLI